MRAAAAKQPTERACDEWATVTAPMKPTDSGGVVADDDGDEADEDGDDDGDEDGVLRANELRNAATAVSSCASRAVVSRDSDALGNFDGCWCCWCTCS